MRDLRNPNDAIDHYIELIQRYEKLPLEKAIPAMCVRSLTIRVGLDAFMEARRRSSVNSVAYSAMKEAGIMFHTLEYMIANEPPDTELRPSILGTMAAMKAILASPAFGSEVGRLVQRIYRREDTLAGRLTATPVQETPVEAEGTRH